MLVLSTFFFSPLVPFFLYFIRSAIFLLFFLPFSFFFCSCCCCCCRVIQIFSHNLPSIFRLSTVTVTIIFGLNYNSKSTSSGQKSFQNRVLFLGDGHVLLLCRWLFSLFLSLSSFCSLFVLRFGLFQWRFWRIKFGSQLLFGNE